MIQRNRAIHRLKFAAAIVALAWFAMPINSIAQTLVDSLFAGQRFAPGPGNDTFTFYNYNVSYSVAEATLSAEADSSDSLRNVKVTFTQFGVLFFPDSASLNSNANFSPFWYGGTTPYDLNTDGNAAKYSIDTLTAQKLVMEAVNPNDKVRKIVAYNGQSVQIFNNDSLGQAGVADQSSSYSQFMLSWTKPAAYAGYSDYGVDAQSINLTVSCSYGPQGEGATVFAPGQPIYFTPQVHVDNLGPNDDINGKIFVESARKYKVAYYTGNTIISKDSVMGPSLKGVFEFGNDSAIIHSTDWSGITNRFSQTVLGVTQVLSPLNNSAQAHYEYYLGADSAFYVANDGFVLKADTNVNSGSALIYNANKCDFTGQPWYNPEATRNGVSSDTIAQFELFQNGSTYSITNGLIYLYSMKNSEYFNSIPQYTNVNGITYTISKNSDTVYVNSGPHVMIGNAGSVPPIYESPWVATPPITQGVQLLLPPNGTKLSGAQPVQFVWTSLGAAANAYNFHISGSSLALDSSLADTSVLVAIDTGAYTWNVTAQNNAGEGPVSGTFTFTISSSAGVAAESAQSVAGIYPNPSSGEVTVRLAAGVSHLELCDLLGRVVQTFDVIGGPEFQFDISGFSAGAYILRDRSSGRHWIVVKE